MLPDQSVRVQKEDLVKINRTSLPLNDDEGGYLAVVDVFHELHCLNYVREYLHRDYYHIKETPETQILHVDHCIDTLRQTLMCHGDIALHTFDWIPDYRRPWPNFNVVHECRNFEAIYDWAEKHSVPTLAGNVLIHPELGKCVQELISAPLLLAKRERMLTRHLHQDHLFPFKISRSKHWHRFGAQGSLVVNGES